MIYMNKNKIIIYLVELAHNGFGLTLGTIPLGIGTIGAYCKKLHGDAIELKLFRQFDDLCRAIKEKTPHIVGFGYYSWNDNLSLTVSAFLRRIAPDTLIVFGGLNVGFVSTNTTQKLGQEDLQLLISNPHIDIIVHGYGEVPFADIVGRFIACGKRLELKTQIINGCSVLMGGKIFSGKPAPALYDLDEIPSPYLMGLFTDFFERFQPMPQLETARGCPYRCSYCTIGGHSSRLYTHSVEYLKGEILYLKDHSPNRVLRIADPNWGIVAHDIQLAEFIRTLYDNCGYPGSLRVYYAANGPIENVKEMAKLLKPLLPLNMSFQSFNKQVLKNVKRRNISLDKVKDMVIFAHTNKIATSTELISGLPGETYNSFRKGFLKAIQQGFDSIYIGQFYLIKGAVLYAEDARRQYGFKTMYSLLGKDVTKVNEHYVVDANEIVTESKTMSQQDFWKIHKFSLFAHLCYAAGFLKEIIMHCLNYNMTPSDVYDELVAHKESYEFFSTIVSQYMRRIRSLHFKTTAALEKKLMSSIKKHANIDSFDVYKHLRSIMGKTLGIQEKRFFITEYVKAACVVYKKRKKYQVSRQKGFYKILNMLASLTADIIITPLQRTQKKILYECSYDLIAWAMGNYEQLLLEYHLKSPRLFALIVRNIEEHYDFIEKAKTLTEIEKYDFYFSTMVSSNMRRYISYAKRNINCAKEKQRA